MLRVIQFLLQYLPYGTFFATRNPDSRTMEAITPFRQITPGDLDLNQQQDQGVRDQYIATLCEKIEDYHKKNDCLKDNLLLIAAFVAKYILIDNETLEVAFLYELENDKKHKTILNGCKAFYRIRKLLRDQRRSIADKVAASVIHNPDVTLEHCGVNKNRDGFNAYTESLLNQVITDTLKTRNNQLDQLCTEEWQGENTHGLSLELLFSTVKKYNKEQLENLKKNAFKGAFQALNTIKWKSFVNNQQASKKEHESKFTFNKEWKTYQEAMPKRSLLNPAPSPPSKQISLQILDFLKTSNAKVMPKTQDTPAATMRKA